ncbi:glycine--tRNA ligase subunit beta [Pediococcus claussenii]|uniref:Glycine--tRNA ligase beta subunit n=1 Tax=Pediococcus claussenii (strain ATCC BAA-344 / DSM 14800 / JCM 18046 / KCTC 3811 / LMG 21948 / P06) TaxID=701521 RepID=G8PD80_PEDCP|nr:glycine--tRNA ligase subunit beta [Pediococcus claussenii]AEV95215.1 glycine--tRNA ligase, beta subunit [Pediococcus claussenii ATCC BAA-344]ANZ70445.1 glycine--tRNA ligase subunit beta [Pediococcus claussenii]ANZ72260.1 glycine--tRNA ligase subunit beta [Pediococcus claussenii]
MMHDYLLELGLEEIPAHIVTPSINQLVERVSQFLEDQQLTFEKIEKFSTPRRLAIKVSGLSDTQPNSEIDAKGPAKKIALDENGAWTKAAMGFARGQGASVEDISFKEVKGTEYVFIHKEVIGKNIKDILPGIKKVIESMNFPTMMKWADFDFKFVRPIRWIVSLLDDEILPFNILDVKAGRMTQGHRFLGNPTTIDNANQYEAKLREEFVLVKADERKDLIRQQIAAIAGEKGWVVQPNTELLEEVNNLVEWPTAFSGQFDPKYLNIPEEVLITSMRDHQRFFFVRDHEGKLLPNFISVRNGNEEHIDNVARGNEKVLTARLEDANFFFTEDQKMTIESYVEKLKKVSFHDKIGTMYEKMLRVRSIASTLFNELDLNASDVNEADLTRAASIYKFDLVTGMVGEFPELQGVMGEKYALLQGENKNVSTAIREHYMPISSDGALPETLYGAVLALADKFDNLFSFFSADMIPTGSNDPYALRRHAIGIVRILENRQWDLNLKDFTQHVQEKLVEDGTAFGVDVKHNNSELHHFFDDRLHQLMDNAKIRYDIADAVLSGNNPELIGKLRYAELLVSESKNSSFKDTIEALTRVQRIASKSKNVNSIIDESLFENDSEVKLFKVISSLRFNLEDPTQFVQNLFSLKNVITDYFEQTMVMDKNEKIKNNRLNQMTVLNNLITSVADFTKVNVK